MKRIVALLNPERYSETAYQLFFAAISATLLGLHLYKPVTEFHPRQHKPLVIAATPEATASWNKQPVRVKTGLQITDFLRFDTVKNEFIINAFIWFNFDPQKVTLETIAKFMFTKGEILQKSEPHLRQLSDGTTFALYSIRVQFSTILDYARFPLDDHNLFLNLTNPSESAETLLYEATETTYSIAPGIYLSGWKIVNRNVESGFTPVTLESGVQFLQNKTVFSLGLSKGDLRQLSLIILPLLFLFYIGIFAFSVRDITVAITLPLASASGLLAYSFVIQTLAPAVGYMMLSDYLFLFFLLSTLIILIVRALVALPEHIISQRTLKKIDGLTILFLYVALVIFWCWVI